MFCRAAIKRLPPQPLQFLQSWTTSSPMTATGRRYLHLHEHQSLALMKECGLTIQKGAVAHTASEAHDIAKSLQEDSPGCEIIVKAQIHAGGRGKGVFSNGFKGGVQILHDFHQVKPISGHMLGFHLVTKQTTAEGQPVNALLVNEGITILKEHYLAILLDREAGGPVVVASSRGGMDVEEMAMQAAAEGHDDDAHAILVEPVDIVDGMSEEQAERIASSPKGLGLHGDLKDQAVHSIMKLYEMFVDCDATQIEVNPLAEASDGKMYCVDAKLNFDDNAQYRQGHIFAMRDTSMEDPREIRAEAASLNYVGLDGNIGCMVNGAGLAMATMDIINFSGGTAANFLDVGGGATKEQVAEAFKILSSDPKVKAILINIFGGIMKCDVIAQGIIDAYKEVGLVHPLIVRLEGTNVERGKQLLEESGLDIVMGSDLDDAAQKAVQAAANGSENSKAVAG